MEKELYVGDLVTGGTSVHSILNHKWQSNIKELEQDEQSNVNEDSTFAKQQLGSETGNLLRMKWDKEADTIQVIIPPDESTPTKRGILGKVARIFDPLGLIAPKTLQGKLLYRVACVQMR